MIFITGCAGFIGFHLTKKILKNKKNKVLGLDNLNNYYDVKLKKDRLKILLKHKNFKFIRRDITNYKKLENIFKYYKPKTVYHLAAQAGVRHSLKNPEDYVKSNLIGFFNILHLSKEVRVNHLLFASTSSIYGDQIKMPITENSVITKPIQFYAATKGSNELMAYSYSKLYSLKITALRFFTVYGPWGRPDMALFKFTKNIINNKKIELYNFGNHFRDFTYIDDCINGILLLSKRKSVSKYDIFNIANGNSRPLEHFIKIIETCLNKKSKKKYLVLQKGDIKKTSASIKKIKEQVNFKPKVSINIGIPKFINWFKEYYGFQR